MEVSAGFDEGREDAPGIKFVEGVCGFNSAKEITSGPSCSLKASVFGKP